MATLSYIKKTPIHSADNDETRRKSLGKEAVNFILDKVGDPYTTAYVTHVSSHPFARRAPHSIVPDLHAHNFPTVRQRMNDSSATSSAEAFLKLTA